MSWLTEGDITYCFICPNCKIQTLVEIPAEIDQDEAKKAPVHCSECEGDHACEYAGFEPRPLNIMMKSVFEQNGRKGIRIILPNGDTVQRSMTKENYLNGRGTESVLTKGCREASTEVKKKIVHDRMVQWKRELAQEAAQRRNK